MSHLQLDLCDIVDGGRSPHTVSQRVYCMKSTLSFANEPAAKGTSGTIQTALSRVAALTAIAFAIVMISQRSEDIITSARQVWKRIDEPTVTIRRRFLGEILRNSTALAYRLTNAEERVRYLEERIAHLESPCLALCSTCKHIK